MSSITNDTVPVVEISITVDSPTNNVPVTLPSPSFNAVLLSLSFGLVERAMASVRDLWGAFGEEGRLMPGSALSFIIEVLIALVAIKAQANTGFPFQTNPRTMKVSVNSLITFALASAAEHVFSPTSVYAVVARFGRMISLNQLGSQGFRNRHHQQQPPLFKCVYERAWLM